MPELIEKWQQGDVGAFETLFQQYNRLVFRTAFLITGSKEEAEDVLQEVFISMWKFRKTFDPRKGKLTTWLHRITLNQCLKKQQRKAPASISLEDREVDLPEMKQLSQPEEILIAKRDYERLLKAMETLEARHRSVLVLRYFDDLSYSDIAGALDIPLGTVKSRLNQGLRYLKERMNMEQGEASA
jgi:RNA polymerase sigma-70 factor (ECF subfamily)